MTLNGQPFSPPEAGLTVAGVLTAAGFAVERVAVIRNGEVVPRSELDRLRVEDEDVLEVVSFVGGG